VWRTGDFINGDPLQSIWGVTFKDGRRVANMPAPPFESYVALYAGAGLPAIVLGSKWCQRIIGHAGVARRGPKRAPDPQIAIGVAMGRGGGDALAPLLNSVI
jgi:hypothetical protein